MSFLVKTLEPANGVEEDDRVRPVSSIGSMFLSAGRDRCSQRQIPHRRTISVGSVLTSSNHSLVTMSSSDQIFSSDQIIPGIPSKRKPLPELFPRLSKSMVWRRASEREGIRCLRESSQFIAIWDCITAILLVYVAIVTPVEVAFIEPVALDSPEFMEFSRIFMFVLNRVVDLVFLVDLAINFCVPYENEEEGKYVRNLRRITVHYLKGWFWPDLISVIPFGLIAGVSGLGISGNNTASTVTGNLSALRVVRVLRLIKLLRLLRSSRIVERWQASVNIKFATQGLVKLVVMMFISCHWFACAWNLVSRWADNGYSSWQIGAGLQNCDWPQVYIASLYWSTMTLTTIGYGDFVPQNEGERVFTICAMFVGAFIYAQLVGNICSTFAEMTPHVSDYHNAMDMLNEYLGELKQDEDIDAQRLAQFKVRLRRYFVQSKTLHKDKYYKAVLQMMSPGLKGAFTSLLYRKSFETVYFFRPPPECDKLKRTLFISAVASKLGSASYPGLERIVFYGEKTKETTTKMFIMRKGIVGCRGKLYRVGDEIGHDIILRNGTRRYLASTLSFVDCLTLTSKDLYDVLDSSEDFVGQRKVVRRATVRLCFQTTILQVIRDIRTFKMSISGFTPVRRMSIPVNISITDLWGKRGRYVFDDPSKRLRVQRDANGNSQIVLEDIDETMDGNDSVPPRPPGEPTDLVREMAELDLDNTTPVQAFLFLQKWCKECRVQYYGTHTLGDV